MTLRTRPGRAGEVVRLFGETVEQQDMYGPVGSRTYHELAQNDRTEVAEVVRLLRDQPGPVLDLGCGSGRFSLPLAAAGHQVVGIDTSRHLLDLLRETLSLPRTRRVASLVQLVEGDMRDLDAECTYGSVVLGTTTVGLLNPVDREHVLRRVARSLRPGGLFLISTQVPLVDQLSERDSVTTVVTPTAVCSVFEYVSPRNQTRAVSVLRIEPGRPPVMLTSTVHLVAPDALSVELSQVGLNVRSREMLSPAGTDELTLLVAERSS